jgi:hypothetical protein
MTARLTYPRVPSLIGREQLSEQAVFIVSNLSNATIHLDAQEQLLKMTLLETYKSGTSRT